MRKNAHSDGSFGILSLLLVALFLATSNCSRGGDCWSGQTAAQPPAPHPDSPDDILSSSDSPARVAATTGLCGSTSGTYGSSLDVPYEWAQIPGAVDAPVVGHVINVSTPAGDLPWTHPFCADYSFNMEVDSAYRSQLDPTEFVASADCSADGLAAGRADDEICEAFDLEKDQGRTPVAVLHSEFENVLIPAAYRPVGGDRVYMRGHLIVDCGHQNFSTELHPPTLIATAGLNPDTGDVHSTLIVVPYHTVETYRPDRLNFLDQTSAELLAAALSPFGVPLNLLADIDTTPFSRLVVAHYRVSIPSDQRKGVPHMGYHFVVRPGIDVQVSQVNEYQADVAVTLDPAKYTPFSAPSCTNVNISVEDADKLAGLPSGTIRKYIDGIGAVVTPLFPVALGAVISLNEGLNVEKCAVPNGTLPAPGSIHDNQVVVDSSQPYPAYGWLDLAWDGSNTRY